MEGVDLSRERGERDRCGGGVEGNDGIQQRTGEGQGVDRRRPRRLTWRLRDGGARHAAAG